MHYRLFFGGTLLLSACAQPYAAPASAPSSLSPEETFSCVRGEMPKLGYKPSSVDVDARRINGTKIDTQSRRPDTQFRRVLDKLEVEVAPQADGRTAINVRGRTFAEYTTQRGPTEVEEKASAEVQSASEQLLKRCRG
ncbi:MAG TPA: hypothetical protein VFB61_02400 [Gemmatimonadales bacterium]|nr:hypothetical protein [Gemmatimonadales bacterium]